MGIKVADIAYVRFSAPDLDRMQGFLEDFGMVAVQRDDHRLAMRGAGAAPFVHMTQRGAPGFVALGLRAQSLADLDSLSAFSGATVEAHDAPGGGSIVRLTDPDGFNVEVVAGQAAAPAQPLAAAAPLNDARAKARLRSHKRTGSGAATVVRLGHAVLNVSNFRASEAWYKDHFGLLTSDEIAVGPGFSIGAFLRCDRGAQPTDHHTLFLLQAPTGPGFNHAAFEVVDLDDLMHGRDHLLAHDHSPEWGVGRHLLGSQIFDYWRDPWHHTLEHWTDGDLFTAADAPVISSLADLVGVQWGMKMPATMR